MIHILYSYIAQENHSRLLRTFLPNFSNDFQRKILTYRRWQDVQLSLLGRLLLKQGMEGMSKTFCEENLMYSAYNKPYFKNKCVKFNISHSGNIVVCVLSEIDEVGIDLEILKNIDIESFKSQMTNLEWKQIISSNDVKNAFYNYWTKKEAVLKAHGMGLSVPLNSFEIINNQTKINGEIFFLKKIELDNEYKCHLAFKNKICTTILLPVEIIFPS
ncbi:4'-phosphopantetheinyl transferase family protein [Aquimarina sp. W85]|uniref:4'-phosphopantetheinyl transferase family protein n=1 Tax=Aquimarina rhodophyticola TaxID=3342246 RepID=UPI003671DE99